MNNAGVILDEVDLACLLACFRCLRKGRGEVLSSVCSRKRKGKRGEGLCPGRIYFFFIVAVCGILAYDKRIVL